MSKRPRFVMHCPVCGAKDSRPDYDFPETMESCNGCLSEWNDTGELTLDARIGLSEAEILQKGWFVDVN